MSEDIQLQQVVINGVIIKVRGHDASGHIIRRMLHRRKGIDLLAERENYDAAGMLSRRSSHAGASPCEPLHLAAALADPPVLAISQRVSVGRFIRNCCDRSRLERLLMAEDNLCVRMCLRLILAGEVKVDIRLLVPLKAQERLKGDVKPGPHQLLSAIRAHLHRHVHAALSGVGFHLLRFKIRIVAVLAVIMRRQGIHLRDSGHGSHKR